MFFTLPVVFPLQMENLSGSSSCSPSSPSTKLCSNYFLLVVQWLRLCFQCRGCRFSPWSRNKDPTCPCCVTWPKKEQNKFFLSRKPSPTSHGFPKKVLFLKQSHQHHCFHVFLQHLSISSQKTTSTFCSSWNLPDLVRVRYSNKMLVNWLTWPDFHRFKNKPEQMFWKVHNLTLKWKFWLC